MKNVARNKRTPQGFTLIEIIAVLVILGILAAVAVPKYMDMQEDAQIRATEGAVAALQSAVVMCHAHQVLKTGSAGLDLTACGQDGTVDYTSDGNIAAGDFAGKASDTSGTITVTVTSGPDWFATFVTTHATDASKDFDLY